MKKIIIISLLAIFVLAPAPFMAKSKPAGSNQAISHSDGQNLQGAAHRPSWNTWVKQLRQEAIAEGVRPAVFDDAFRGLRPDQRTLNFDKRQPEKRLSFNKYRKTRGDNYRILIGIKEYKRYKPLLNKVGRSYGVDPCFIVALWGIESSYGRFMGSFPVIKSLATLAYDPRRSDFFRRELLYALQILNGGHIDNKNFKGEWAGASGQPQFLPSSWFNYAVDYNGDGYKDIWKNHGDIFASIANYLSEHGWQTGQPWAIEVDVPGGFNKGLLGKETKKSVGQWQQLGIYPTNGHPMPSKNLQASIIKPYGGPYIMTFTNFRVLMRYNNSTYYAGTVGYMADKICRR